MAKVLMYEQAAAPSTPDTNYWALYFKPTGLYVKDDAGTETQVDASTVTASLAAHVADVANPHAVTASQVGITLPGASVDSEVMLYNGVTGASFKRAAISGLALLTAGVLSAAADGTDYVSPSGQGFGTPTAMTLTAGGEITITSTNKFQALILDTFGAAAAQNLVKINGGVAGMVVKLQTTNAARDITVVNSSDLPIGQSFTLDGVHDRIVLECHAANVWVQLSRSSNG